MLLIRKTWCQWAKKPFSGAVVFLCSFIYINESFNFRTIKKDNANLVLVPMNDSSGRILTHFALHVH